jgi:hypothetical protein
MKQAGAHDLENRRTLIIEARYEAQLRRAEEAGYSIEEGIRTRC